LEEEEHGKAGKETPRQLLRRWLFGEEKQKEYEAVSGMHIPNHLLLDRCTLIGICHLNRA
jgi:hypothetical protein